MRIESSGNLTIDHLRHRAEAQSQLIAFADPRACDPAAGPARACRCESTRAADAACDAGVDRLDRADVAGFTGPVPGEGYGGVDEPESPHAGGDSPSASPGWADTGVGGMLDVFA
mgnify:CR=1 FL=1